MKKYKSDLRIERRLGKEKSMLLITISTKRVS